MTGTGRRVTLADVAERAGVSRALASGTWWARQESSAFLPSMISGQVQPLGVRKMIMGQAGRLVSPAAARALIMFSLNTSTALAICPTSSRRAVAGTSTPNSPPASLPMTLVIDSSGGTIERVVR